MSWNWQYRTDSSAPKRGHSGGPSQGQNKRKRPLQDVYNQMLLNYNKITTKASSIFRGEFYPHFLHTFATEEYLYALLYEEDVDYEDVLNRYEEEAREEEEEARQRRIEAAAANSAFASGLHDWQAEEAEDDAVEDLGVDIDLLKIIRLNLRTKRWVRLPIILPAIPRPEQLHTAVLLPWRVTEAVPAIPAEREEEEAAEAEAAANQPFGNLFAPNNNNNGGNGNGNGNRRRRRNPNAPNTILLFVHMGVVEVNLETFRIKAHLNLIEESGGMFPEQEEEQLRHMNDGLLPDPHRMLVNADVNAIFWRAVCVDGVGRRIFTICKLQTCFGVQDRVKLMVLEWDKAHRSVEQGSGGDNFGLWECLQGRLGRRSGDIASMSQERLAELMDDVVHLSYHDRRLYGFQVFSEEKSTHNNRLMNGYRLLRINLSTQACDYVDTLQLEQGSPLRPVPQLTYSYVQIGARLFVVTSNAMPFGDGGKGYRNELWALDLPSLQWTRFTPGYRLDMHKVMLAATSSFIWVMDCRETQPFSSTDRTVISYRVPMDARWLNAPTVSGRPPRYLFEAEEEEEDRITKRSTSTANVLRILATQRYRF